MMAAGDGIDSHPLRVVGLMCGTSIDAIDAAVVDISGSSAALRVNLIGFQSIPVPPALRRRILQACMPGGGSSRLVCELNAEIGEAFAGAARAVITASGLQCSDVDLIGSHGQTVWHQGKSEDGSVASTLQLGEPGIIAERTGITTVADFRPRDMAAGGQGAPLVSYVDWALYRSAGAGRALQNIGGIANVTVLPADCRPGDVFAFDTGPGNMLLDALAGLTSKGTLTYDRDGRLALSGHADAALLGRILAHPFFDLTPPRTAGREQFGQAYAQTIWQEGAARGLAAADMLATATLVTAHSIADAYRRWILPRVALEGMYVSGGGARNPALLEALRRKLPEVQQYRLSDLGGDTQAKEAVAFAVLAAESVRNVPTSLPGATGARHASVLGKMVPGANWRRLQRRLMLEADGSSEEAPAGNTPPIAGSRSTDPGPATAAVSARQDDASRPEKRANRLLQLPDSPRPGQVTFGIDGGGTTTTGVAMDSSGVVVARAIGGPSNIQAAGRATAGSSLQVVLAALCDGMAPGATVVGLHAALAGAGRAEDAAAAQHLLWNLCHVPDLAPRCEGLRRDDIGVSNDALAVLAAGEVASGMVVIAGTGSFVWGRNAAGETARAGGWGYLLGDEGGGFDLGRRALVAVLADYDRSESQSALATALLCRLGLSSPPDLVSRIYGSAVARTDIAGLAPVVLQSMAAGDPMAQRLVLKSVEDLAAQVRLVASRLQFDSTPNTVVCSGGLFHNDAFFQALRQALRNDAGLLCRRPAYTPAEGAALLAWIVRSLAEMRPDGA